MPMTAMETATPAPTSNYNCATSILLVDDNPADVRLLRYVLDQERDWQTDVNVIPDGEKAIDFLLRKDSFSAAQKPDLVVLDLHLPKKDGVEILQVIRSADALRDLPVAVLSTLPEETIESVCRRADLRADAYLTKPPELEEFLELGKKLRRCCGK